MSVAVVFKSPYVKGGKVAGKAGYIARRIGVDKGRKVRDSRFVFK